MTRRVLWVARAAAGAGFLLVAAGASMLSPAAGLITAGALLLALSIGALR